MIASLYRVNGSGTTHFDSEDDHRTDCRNVSHCQQQFYSGLHSSGRSYSTLYEMIPGFEPFTDKTKSAKLRVLIFREMHSVVEVYFSIRPLTKSFLSIAMHLSKFLDKRTGNVRRLPTYSFLHVIAN